MNDPDRDNWFAKEGGSINLYMVGVKAAGLIATFAIIATVVYLSVR